MLGVPWMTIVNLDLIDKDVLACCTFTENWNAQPNRALVGFDTVAVAPAMLIILDVIKEYENIGQCDLVEVTTPGNI
jgi:hypothetical protein